MASLDVPPQGAALSVSESTPHLTINHDVAADLDSSNAFEGPEKLLEVWFAPSASSLPATAKPDGLKAVDAETWVGMLDMVNCQILSVLKSDNVDAYLLSESSMFVFPHKIILKTCGTTTLLLGLQRMLHIAAVHAGFPFHNAESVDDIRAAATPYRVFYSRKNFLFPDKQRGPHRNWSEEVKYLDDMFDGGSAYMVGKMNGDHWYLYITSPSHTLTPPRTPDGAESPPKGKTRLSKIPAGCVTYFPAYNEDLADETLEILMTDLDPEHAKQFYLTHASAVASDQEAKHAEDARREAVQSLGHISAHHHEPETAAAAYEPPVDVFSNHAEGAMETTMGQSEALTTEGHALGTVVSDLCGLSDVYPKSIYPEARIDAYMFTPCGFSANGVVPAPGPVVNGGEADGEASGGPKSSHYFTVHVTPEPSCSFASFETNVPGGQSGRTTADIIDHVVGIFKPGRFSMTLFEAKADVDDAYSHGDRDLVRSNAARKKAEPVKGYRCVERIVHDFDDYDLVFRYYERDDWTGDATVRVGEEST